MSEEQIHQAYWFLKQLHEGVSDPDHFINFRAIHNGKPFRNNETGRMEYPNVPTYDEFVKIKDFKKAWNERILNHLLYLNSDPTRPSNIYFSINPLQEKGHKKEHYAGFLGFYLDLDGNKNYTKEQRWAQIFYWSQLGFKPSLTNDSGNGYHVYWLFKKLYGRDVCEALLKRMVALSDCKEGGNTFDISRVYRLPGFLNVKEWYDGKTPACGLVIPEDWSNSGPVEHFDIEKFEAFPPSSLSNLEAYYREARRQSTNPEDFQIKVQQVLAGATEMAKNLAAQQASQRIAVQNQIEVNETKPDAVFTPKLTVVPHRDEVTWGRGYSWIKKYCQRGHAGLTQGEIDDIAQKQSLTDTSASAMDFLVIYRLVAKGYTKDAVREFWIRPDNKLYRPDKEAKNANYFESSYDKALTYVQASAAQHKHVIGEDPIYCEHFQTFCKGKEGSELLLTAEMRLNAIYDDKDASTPNDRQWFDFSVFSLDPTASEGTARYEIFIPNAAFNALADFKKYTHDLFRVVTNNGSHLQRIIKHLTAKYRNVPTIPFHSKMMVKKDKFVFPTFIVTKDSIEKRADDSPMVKKLLSRVPLFSNFKVAFKPKEEILAQLKKYWKSTLSMHLPRVVASMLGTISISAVAPIFDQVLGVENFHVPTINIRGASHTAKTETIAHLYTVCGIHRGKNTTSARSSEFALSQTIGSTNFLPIFIDEFKEEENNQKQLTMIRQLVRRIYSGEGILKGRKDMSVIVTEIHGGLIIGGETPLERTGNLSETSRIIPISTDDFQPSKHLESYAQIENIQWYELCPLFYQWILQQDPQGMFDEFKTLKLEVMELIKGSFSEERLRMSQNLTCVWFGCRLFDKFILSLDPTLPTIETVCDPKKSIIEYMCQWTVECGQSLTMLNTEGEKSVVANNELFSMLKTFGQMVEMKDKIVRDMIAGNMFSYKVDEDKNLLAIHFNAVYHAYLDYMAKYKTTYVPSEAKLKSLIRAADKRKESWLEDASKLIKVNSAENQVVRCVLINLRQARIMGIWPTKNVLSFSNDVLLFPDEEKRKVL